MKKLKVWAVVALVFLGGFVSGVVATRVVVRRVVMQIVTNPNRVRSLIEKRMAVRLRLNAEQRGKVDEILTRTQADLNALKGDFTPRFTSIMSNTESEISATLTPEQQERLRRFFQEHRHLWQPR